MTSIEFNDGFSDKYENVLLFAWFYQDNVTRFRISISFLLFYSSLWWNNARSRNINANKNQLGGLPAYTIYRSFELQIKVPWLIFPNYYPATILYCVGCIMQWMFIFHIVTWYVGSVLCGRWIYIVYYTIMISHSIIHHIDDGSGYYCKIWWLFHKKEI